MASRSPRGQWVKLDGQGKYAHQIIDSSVQSNTSYCQSSYYKVHLSRQKNCWSLRCSWSSNCLSCPNYIFILDLTPGPRLNIKTVLSTYGDFHVKDKTAVNMGIAIPGKTVFLIETAPWLQWIGQNNCKTKQETFKFGDLVQLILEVWWYMHGSSCYTKVVINSDKMPEPMMALTYSSQDKMAANFLTAFSKAFSWR